jgi:hypothetical protein
MYNFYSGGSVQTHILKDHVLKLDQQGDGEAWKTFRHKIDNNVVIILTSLNQAVILSAAAMNNIDDADESTTNSMSGGKYIYIYVYIIFIYSEQLLLLIN